MLRSIDIAERENIINPRIIDWNIVATQWEYNSDKDRYVSIEYIFTYNLKWEKRIVTKKKLEDETEIQNS